MKATSYILGLLLLMTQLAAFGQRLFSTSELEARRKAALEQVPDGIILLRSYSGLKHWDESGFHQDSSFYYFTGLANVHGAILALDGRQKESWLFVAPRQGSFGAELRAWDSISLDPGAQTEKELKIDHVAPWDQFVSFIESRRKDNSKLVLYTDSAGQTGRMSGEASVPQGLDPLENSHWVWADMLHRHWADLEVKDAFAILDEVRSVKSTTELTRLRQAARATEKGFWAGVNAISPGRTQRQVAGCWTRAWKRRRAIAVAVGAFRSEHDGEHAEMLMAAELKETGGSLQAASIRSLFEMSQTMPLSAAGMNPYDATRDGTRFVVDSVMTDESPAPLSLVINWTAELKGK